jgi:hypothetical protein
MSQIGLFLATGILLSAVLSSVFFNNWQRTSELKSFTSNFSSLAEDIGILFFENKTRFQFPERTYPYRIQLSSEYIAAVAKGFWGADLHVTERLHRKVWIRSPLQNWTSGDDLHEYLNRTYGHHGLKGDSLSSENFTALLQEQNISVVFYASQPLEIFIREPIFLEKVTIFYGDEQKQDFLLVYQLL